MLAHLWSHREREAAESVLNVHSQHWGSTLVNTTVCWIVAAF
jgi:hypothetical protein